jgi:hypothetical protein
MFLKGHDCFYYVGGSSPPPTTIFVACTDVIISIAPNPAYHVWTKQDQMILSIIISTLFDPYFLSGWIGGL